MKLNAHQRLIMSRLTSKSFQYICLHGYSFRLCDPDGNYICCVSTPTIRCLQEAGMISVRHYCPNPKRPEQSQSWVATAEANRQFPAPQLPDRPQVVSAATFTPRQVGSAFKVADLDSWSLMQIVAEADHRTDLPQLATPSRAEMIAALEPYAEDYHAH